MEELQLNTEISVSVDDYANVRIAYNKRTLEDGTTATDFLLCLDHAAFNRLANYVDSTVKKREQEAAEHDPFFDRADHDHDRQKDGYYEQD